MRVVEKFLSIEGEGKRTGVLCSFIRLAGCNLRCGYCDTDYSQKFDDGKDESITDIIAWARDQHVKSVTVTGGEPLIHRDIAQLLYALVKSGFSVNVETNGSVNIETIRDAVYSLWNCSSINFPASDLFFTVDYKCPTSGMEEKMCLSNFNIYALTRVDCVKFVVGSLVDLAAARDVYTKLGRGIKCYFSPVWGQIQMKDMVEFMIRNKDTFESNAHIQIQLHKIIYPLNMRGV